MGELETADFGRYVLHERLAVGGMAEIFLATLPGPHEFRKPVVIKRMLECVRDDPQYMQMFRSEANLAARLTHPNLVQIFGFEEIEGALCIIMEYLKGRDLRWVLSASHARHYRISPELCAFVVMEASCGLHAAHELAGDDGEKLGVVHRDISPSNLIITSTGTVKVLDFGIAKFGGSGRTRTGIVKGKACYMSPEQARGERVDARSDVFSLGVVLYELLTTHRFIQAGESHGAMRIVAGLDDVSDRLNNERIPPRLRPVLQRMLEPSKHRRYQSLEGAISGLEAFLGTLHFHATDLIELLGTLEETSDVEQLPWTGGTEITTLDEKLRDPRTTIEIDVADLATLAAPAPQEKTDQVVLGSPRFGLLRRHLPATVLTGLSVLIAGMAIVVFASIPALPTDGSNQGSDGGAEAHGGRQDDRATIELHGSELRGSPSSDPAPTPVPSPGIAPSEASAPAQPNNASRQRPPKRAAARAEYGRLSVVTIPATQILWRGKPIGKTPFDEVRLPAGEHRFTLRNRKLGIQRIVSWIVKPDRTTRKRLEFAKGTLAFRVDPWADVWIDGAHAGTTPMKPIELYEGRHDVVLRNEQLAIEKRLSVDVVAGQLSSVTRDLR